MFASEIGVALSRGKVLHVAGTEYELIVVAEAAHIPGLYRRLLSFGKLSDRGMGVEYRHASRVIWNMSKAIIFGNGHRIEKTYVLEYHQDITQYVDSHPGRMSGHFSNCLDSTTTIFIGSRTTQSNYHQAKWVVATDLRQSVACLLTGYTE